MDSSCERCVGMSGVNEIRSTFLDYFKKNGHEIVPSSPLVPRNDPTLMFTNAGMVQFKNVFTGLESRPYSTAASAQKCVRAGGKHNDLDNVGYTARHHTFFEMLGNFSFGDYFKEEAITHAWNLITKEFGIDRNRLLVTVYHTDDEAFNLWKKIAGFSDDRIIRIPTSDNFWAMGDTGPCGPCSEIFYDHGDHIWGGPPGSPEEDGDRFIEIWNLVFMQYEQLTKEERIDLPRPSIDTGMGLERISALLQGKHDNYDTDLFRALIAASVEATGVPAEGEHRASHRVIADHLRSSAFLIADGVLPSSEGRGYVLRRIMRRAMRHAELLGSRDPLIYRLLPALIQQMGRAYPELVRAEALISETLKLEETRFRKTLERGLSLLSDATSTLHKGDMLDGETAFKLALKPVLHRLAQKDVEDAIAAVGRGEVSSLDVLRAVFPDYQDERVTVKMTGDDGWFNMRSASGMVFKIPGKSRSVLEDDGAAEMLDGPDPLPIRGLSGNVDVHFSAAGAVPGDRIVGIMEKGKGITIYPIQAPALQRFDDEPERWIDVRWDLDEANKSRFMARVMINALNEPGTLASVAQSIATLDVNIRGLNMVRIGTDFSELALDVEVWDLRQLNQLLSQLKDLDCVSTVARAFD